MGCLRSGLFARRGMLVFGFFASSGAAACNLIAGIDEGVLVTTGPDGAIEGGAKREASSPPDGSTHHDATSGPDGAHGAMDGGRDASDAGSVTPDGGHRVDTGVDAAPPPPTFTCSLVGNFALVDDLSTWDSGVPTYTPHIFVAPATTESNGFWIIAQTNGESSDILAYQVSLGNDSYGRVLYPGVGNVGGIVLLDVQSRSAGTASASIDVLTSFAIPSHNLSGEYGLEIVNVPPSFFSGSENGYVFATNGGVYYDARLVELAPNDAGLEVAAIAMVKAGIISEPDLLVSTGGQNADGGTTSLGFSSPSDDLSFNGNEVFFATASDIGAFIAGFPVGDAGADGGYLAALANQNLSEAGVAGNVLPPSMGALIAGHTSAVDRTKVLMFAAELDGPNAKISTASVPPSMLAAITQIGAQPPFSSVPGNSIPLSAAPFNGAASGWAGDDLVLAGPDGTDRGLVLGWLSPQGRVVASAHPITDASPIGQSAVQFDSFFGDTSAASFDLAWVEHVPAGASSPAFDRLYAAKVSCIANADGG